MKIIYLTTGLYTGGAEMMLYKLLSKIDRDRFDPTVVSLMDNGTIGERIESLGFPVYLIGMKPGIPSLSAILKLLKIVREIQPDLIQGWMYHGNLAALLAYLFSTKKTHISWGIRASVYSLDLQKKMTAFINKLCAYFSKLPSSIIFVSHIAKKQHEALGYSDKKSCVIHNGFETSIFVPSSEAKLMLRSELGIAKTSFLIGLIGRYHPMKDHANFVKAASLLLKSHPDIHFVLVGRGVNRENQELSDLIHNLGVAKQMHLLGERQDIHHLTAALDIATSSSAYGEGFPNVIGEAMSCEVPCVVTDVGDSSLIVGNTGTVVSPRNPEALAEAWKSLISLERLEREILGKAARQRIIDCFSLDSIIHQYESLYESLLAIK